MIDLEKTGKRIAFLRKERGYTGEALAEKLQISSQAISKWENARCLPETAILPALADALDCSIDSLLCPRELFILEAVYTDGQTHIPVTRFVDDLVRGSRLSICVNEFFVGASIESDRVKMLTVKYQTPDGTGFSYALQNENLVLDKKNPGFPGDRAFQIIGAYYGNEKGYSSAMQKMEHYEYFKWDRIAVNQETFPSNPASDDTEYLTLVYLNAEGIHVLSCPENDTVYYGKHGTELLLMDRSKCILKDVMRLTWEDGPEAPGAMMCPWAGSLHAALAHMGESFTYNQIMGMSGACYRTCFVDIWDYSCTDALVAYDYATPLYNAIGYSFRMVDRLEKQERKAERQAIMEDIQNGKPVLAINLRVAAEWGVITGYTDNGNRFLCRTYFDDDVFKKLEQQADQELADSHENMDGRMQTNAQIQEESRIIYEENEGYLFSDFWPFLIIHFGEKKERKSPLDILKTSLAMLIASFHAEDARGYHQGRNAYRAWIGGLSKESDFRLDSDRENVLRRLDINDSMLCHLIDSRRAAADWLRENIALAGKRGGEQLAQIAENYRIIFDSMTDFRSKVCHSAQCAIRYNMVNAFGVSTPELRKEQINLLEQALILEEENCRLAELVLEAFQ